jgi:Tfp pilus assembly protein PilF
MRRFGSHLALVVVIGLALAGLWNRPAEGQAADSIWTHRNLGKAFYENPTTGPLAVEEFRQALALAPDSPRDRINYGLALLRAGKTQEGIAELERAQAQDPSIPHTWFNLGIAFKKDSQYEKAIVQFEQMVKLVPGEPVSHYNLGYLYKLTDRPADALREFERAEALDPNLAGPHYQLYNFYREAGRTEDAAREQARFQQIRKQQTGAAVPEDLDWSFYAEILDPVDPADAANPGTPVPLEFGETRLPGSFDVKAPGLLAFDADGDGRLDLLAWSADTVRLYRHGETPVEDAGLAGLKGVRAVAAGDLDNDGFPDLAVVTASGAVLYTNANGAFTRSSTALPSGDFRAAVWLDYDHDYDLDLFLLGDAPVLLRNNGRAGFSDQTAEFPFVEGRAIAGVTLNFVADTGGRDLVVSYAGRPAVLYRDLLGGKYRAEPIEALPAGAAPLVARDVDNDGRIDLAAGGAPGLVLLLNRAPRWERAPVAAASAPAITTGDFENRAFADLVVGGAVLRNQALGRLAAPGRPVLPGAVATAAADFDGDGKIDLAGIVEDGSLRLLRNRTPVSNAWARVALEGVKNLRLAPGAIVEVKAGVRYQKQMYDGSPLHFGLRDAARIDTVRITWPNGLIQNEVKQQTGQALAFKEAQRLSGSCPMIFTWNGREFQFITDVLGVAPLGASAGDGTYFPVDHDEYIQIPGEALMPTSGGSSYEIRITEELHEVTYLDQVKLIAVDHPSAVDIFTNDKFKAPPFPAFRLFGVRNRVYPVTARDGEGRDVRPALLAKDRTYPDGFERNYAGVAALHTLDLDFGGAAPDNRAVLVLSGWVDWADGSTFLGASQEDPRGLIFPSIQVKDASGRWTTVVEDMGMPSGKPKTMVVDLTGKFLSASREVRIVTNLCLYWDEIFLGEDPGAPDVVLTPIGAEHADLRFRGFSTPTIDPERKQPESFDYQRPMPISTWNPTSGLYTRYGDVRPLAADVDDRLIIMGSGDELRLRFPAGGLPSLRAGWRRDFLLLVDGWAKDADANTAFSQTVGPLPFHGMSSYPYPASESYPNTPLLRRYRETYNTRPALRLLRPLAVSHRLPDSSGVAHGGSPAPRQP